MGRDEPGNEEKEKMEKTEKTEKTEELGDHRKKISELSEYDSRERDVYLFLAVMRYWISFPSL